MFYGNHLTCREFYSVLGYIFVNPRTLSHEKPHEYMNFVILTILSKQVLNLRVM